jgi:hypothetical protein
LTENLLPPDKSLGFRRSVLMNDHHAAEHSTDRFSAESVSAGELRPVTSMLHRRVYATVVGLAIWMVLSVWLFAGAGVTDYLLFVVSGFIFVAVTLVSILSRVGGKAAKNRTDLPPLREWARWDFEIGQGQDRSRLSSVQAVMQILLPIAAVAFGMTIFGMVLLIVERVSV